MRRVILFVTALVLFSNYSFADRDYYQDGLKFLAQDNIEKSIEAFKKSSKDGNALAMFKLGLISEVQEKNQKAIEWYEKAKAEGNIKAKYRLGVLSCKMKTYIYIDDFKDYAKEAKKDVQYDLAVCISQKGDKKEALKWFKIVANKNDAKAQYRVAMLVSSKEKIRWLKKSAKNGYVEAKFDLGKILFMQKKFKKAKYWLKQAKKSGSRRAGEYLKRMKELDL